MKDAPGIQREPGCSTYSNIEGVVTGEKEKETFVTPTHMKKKETHLMSTETGDGHEHQQILQRFEHSSRDRWLYESLPSPCALRPIAF
jgi:hypothetical protein